MEDLYRQIQEAEQDDEEEGEGEEGENMEIK